MKQLKLFLAVFFGGGFCIVALAFTGGLIAGKTGFYIGAPLGGYLGIHLAAKLAEWRDWIVKSQLWPTMIGAVLAFGLAEAFQKWVISSAAGSFGAMALVGLGAVIGSRISRRSHGED